ncbi:hypothetical protein [Leeuwenhoekiella aequorea]|uniref:Uncharacterized protein n=1 Tax=Leeuwenhoekiella aequorea TaxID=283736 RepID=A0A4Q0PAD9_9FLAO|nr:hypothetical protein [Leeuwenhoekiella aequorea]RXG23687.1 hypothetical protein DSM00_1303 [Leeuwenhoekiella aequorea]
MEIDNNNKEQFNIPSDYFKSFDDRLFTELKFQELFPNKVDVFTVPENYFEDVSLKIIEQNKPQGKLISYDFKMFAKAFVALAAVVVLLFYVINPVGTPEDFDSLSVSSIESYLIDQDQLPYYFSDEDLSNIEDNTSIFDQQLDSEEVIYDYIDQDIIETSWTADQ